MHGGTSWAEREVLDFSDNLNPLGPPQKFLELIREAVERRVYLKFPANLAEEVLSEYEGVDVTLFDGATEALEVVLSSLRPKRLLLPWPTYSDYVRIARAFGLEVVTGELEELARRAGPRDVVILCNPNNPTGALFRRDQVLELNRALSLRGASLVADESFLDFVDEESAAPDVLVVKSYGKILAVPGLRLGAILGDINPDLKPPWRVNSIADYALYHTGPEALRCRRPRGSTYRRRALECKRPFRDASRCLDRNYTSLWLG
ncbi:MAG: aminotransferase class I/II-fold pyridoxal phosphate-dependent enzyme [Pyrobaculum sp.]